MNHVEHTYDLIDELPLWSAIPGCRILDNVKYRRNICALDIGFGLGFPLIELAMRLGNTSTVFGIDPWKAGIKYTKNKLKITQVKNVKLIEGIAEQMPFEDNMFDLIVSNNGVNNVQDLDKSLMECNRVAKLGAQFIFSLNTNETFLEFYKIYRSALKDNGLNKFEDKITAHIYSKRKPISEIKDALKNYGFRIKSINKDKFTYHFANSSAMMNHFAIQLLFMKSWKQIIPTNSQKKVFKNIENKINKISDRKGKFSMTVPFVTIDCKKVRDI